MTNIYVIIQAGYEGIEGLLYASIIKSEAIEDLNRRRQAILYDKARMEVILKEHGQDINDIETEWDVMYVTGKITDEEYSNGKYTESDSICIQLFDGKEFKCVCNEEDVSPNKTWLM